MKLSLNIVYMVGYFAAAVGDPLPASNRLRMMLQVPKESSQVCPTTCE